MRFLRIVFAALSDVSIVEIGSRFSARAYCVNEWGCWRPDSFEFEIYSAYGPVFDMPGM